MSSRIHRGFWKEAWWQLSWPLIGIVWRRLFVKWAFHSVNFRKCDKREHYDNSSVMMVKILKTNISVNVQLTVWEKFASRCLKSFIVKSCSKLSPSKVPIHKLNKIHREFLQCCKMCFSTPEMLTPQTTTILFHKWLHMPMHLLWGWFFTGGLKQHFLSNWASHY